MGKNEPAATIRALDDISNEVCKAIDVADFCRSIHCDAAFRSSAADSFAKLSACIRDLNSDTIIYDKICEIHRHNLTTYHLDDEDYYFVNDMKAELENEGVHLIGEEKKMASVIHVRKLFCPDVPND